MRQWIGFLAMLLLVSCTRSTIAWVEQPDEDFLDLTVIADWSDAVERPTGMTVYFYPQSGAQPRKVITNNVDSITVSLPLDTYDILIFSLTEEEYASVGFTGMDGFETSMTYLKESYEQRSAGQSSSVNGILTRPNVDDLPLLAAAAERNVTVADSVATEVNGKKRVRVGPLKANRHFTGMAVKKPNPVSRPIIVTANVRITTNPPRPSNVAATRAGDTEIITVSGKITGLACESMLGMGCTTSQSYVKVLPDWNVTVRDVSPTVKFGKATTSFYSFGKPNSPLYGRDDFELVDDSVEHEIILELDITLGDGTGVHAEFDVTDQVDRQEDEDETDIVVGAEDETDESPDNPFIDVVIEQTEENGGFNVEVDGWDERDVNIVVKTKPKKGKQ